MSGWDSDAPWLRPDPAADARFPAIGFCPCPGDQRTAEHVAAIVRRTANSLRDIAHVLNGTGRGDWRGKAAEAFREQFHDDFRPKVEDARDSFGQAAQALEDWTSYMEGRQREADKLEQLAQEAKDRAGAAQKDLDGMPPKPGTGFPGGPGGPPPKDESHEDKAKREKLEADRSGKEKALHSANGELEELRGQAERLRNKYTEKGESVADRLKHAMDIAPNEPGIWDRIGDAISELADTIGEISDAILDEIKSVLKELAPLLKVLGDIAGFASTVLGLLSLIPGLQFLALPALILGGVALASHYLSAVGTTGSFMKALTDPTVIIDAVTLAFGGAAFGAGLKLMKAAGATGSYAKIAGATMKVGSKSGLPSVPGYFRFCAGMGKGGLQTTEFGFQAARFTNTIGGNFMGLVPGGGAAALGQISQGQSPWSMPKMPNLGKFPTPTGPFLIPRQSGN
ncbi:putative T7SS-secreted protein [Actinomycetota bacterium Odt1-20B]